MPNTSTFRQFFDKYETWISVALVIATNFLTLGRFTPSLGIYYDEYVTFYVLERFGLWKLIELAGGQARHLAGGFIAMVHTNLLYGHMLMFLLSTVSALLLMVLLRRIFHDMPYLTTLFAIFYLVYPVYFVRVYLTALAIDASFLAVLLSLTLSYLALRRRGGWRWGLIALSLVLIPIYVNLYEMPIALEVVRPFIIWAALRDDSHPIKPRLSSVIRWTSLWIVAVGATIVYRLFIFEPYGFYAEIAYNTELVNVEDSLFIIILQALFGIQATFQNVWKFIFEQFHLLITPYGVVVASLIALMGFTLVQLMHKQTSGLASTRIRRPLLLANFGFALSFVSHIIILLVGHKISPDAYMFNHLSRLYIVSNIGAILTVLGILWFLNNLIKARIGTIVLGSIVAVLLFGGTIAHTFWHHIHVESWNRTRNFMWQLAEIAPNLQDGTTIIVDHDHAIVRYPYIPFIIGDLFYDNPSIALVIASDISGDVMPSFSLDNGDWGFGWTSDVQQAIFVHEDANGCVWLIDPALPLPEDIQLSENSQGILEMLPANPSQFITSTPLDNPILRERYLPRPDEVGC